MHFCKGVSNLETHMDYFALWDWSCKKMTFPAHWSKWHTNGNFSLLLESKNNLYMFLNLRYLYINNECSHLIFKMNGYYINNENLFFFSEIRYYDSFLVFTPSPDVILMLNIEKFKLKLGCLLYLYLYVNSI